jgi:hypothetical protein
LLHADEESFCDVGGTYEGNLVGGTKANAVEDGSEASDTSTAAVIPSCNVGTAIYLGIHTMLL